MFMKSIKVIIISISITTFLLLSLLHNACFAKGDLGALGNLKGVYVNLKVRERVPHGMVLPRINRVVLSKHIKNELTELFRYAKGFKIYNTPSIVPHLNVAVTIEGISQRKGYNITTKASLKQEGLEWWEQITGPWSKQSVREPIKEAEKAVKSAEKNLKSEQIYLGEVMYSEWIRNKSRGRIERYKTILANAEKRLAEVKKDSSLLSRIKLSITTVNTAFLIDYTQAWVHEKEFEKTERETAELLNQLEQKKEVTSSGSKEHYIKYGSRSRLNILYETGNIVRLHNPSDTTVAIYKDESLSNITNIFTNGIGATVIEFKTFPDKPIAYKVQILLKDGSEYTGWVHENVIRP